MINQIFEQIRTILCLDGELPESSYFPKGKKIVAADGAANKLMKLGVIPDFIIGDLDSLEIEDFSYSQIIQNEEQESTDFKKCLNYIVENNLGPIIIYGVTGGFLDRILDNIDLALQTESIFYSPGLIGITINNQINLLLEDNTKISIFGFEAIISTKGLKWELTNEKLNFPGKNSACNRVTSSQVEIKLKKGKALILIYENEIKDKGSRII